MALHTRHTECSIEIWCPWAQEYGFTNVFGGLHFCQFCGSTDHDPDGPTGAVRGDVGGAYFEANLR